MKPTINKIRAGKYMIKHHGFAFIIESNGINVWTISNHAGIELYRDASKKALINMLSSCNYDCVMQLHQQQFCKYA